MFNVIIAMLHNMKTNRWHPIMFSESPLPGPPSEGKPIRHKSRGHHTAGFDSREEAVAHITGELSQRVESQYGKPRLCIEKDFPWDGEDTPAMVVFFDEFNLAPTS